MHVKMVGGMGNAKDVYGLQPRGKKGPQNLRNFQGKEHDQRGQDRHLKTQGKIPSHFSRNI